MSLFGFTRLRGYAAVALALGLSLGARTSAAQELDFSLGGKTSTPPIPIELASGKVHLKTRIGDWGAQWLLLDTGANMSILNWEIATAKGLELRGHGTTNSAAGGNTFEFAFTELPAVKVANLEIAARTVAVIKRHTEAANGHQSIGLIGADVMKALVVEVDYPASTIRFHDPATFEYAGDGVSVPLTLDQNSKPHIQALLTDPEGHSMTADLVVDTGGRGFLVLSRPFVEEHHLEQRLEPPLLATTGVGIGGEVKHHLARMQSLRVGGFELLSPIVELPLQGTTGAYGRDDRSGVLEARFLERFRVFFDYPHERLILEPGPHFERPFEHDGSGTFLVAYDFHLDGVEVLRVAPDTPASEAGMQAGDQLISIDGQSVVDLGLDGVRALFMEFGRTLALVVQRGSETLELELSIRRLV